MSTLPITRSAHRCTCSVACAARGRVYWCRDRACRTGATATLQRRRPLRSMYTGVAHPCPPRCGRAVGAHHAAADDRRPWPAATPGTPPSSTPRPAVAPAPAQCAAGLDGEPPRDLGHRREQRQTAIRRGHRFIGNADRRRWLTRSAGLLGVRRQMQVGEQQLALAQHGALSGQRLLDLDDQLRPFEDRLCTVHDRRAHRGVVLVIGADCRRRRRAPPAPRDRAGSPRSHCPA